MAGSKTDLIQTFESILYRKQLINLKDEAEELQSLDDGLWSQIPWAPFLGITKSTLWKLCVDKQHWELGRLAYDTDRDEYDKFIPGQEGYIDALESAALFILLTLNIPLSTDYLKILHSLTTHGIQRNNHRATLIPSSYQETLASSPFSLNQACFRLKPWTVSRAGLNEIPLIAPYLESIIITYENTYKIRDLKKDNLQELKGFQNGFLARDSESTSTPETLNQFFKEYENAMNELYSAIFPLNKKQMLLNIVQLVRKINLLHPFPHGNTRICNLLLTKLLIANQFGPSSLITPHILDGFSIKEIAYELTDNLWVNRSKASDYKLSPPASPNLTYLKLGGLFKSPPCDPILAAEENQDNSISPSPK